MPKNETTALAIVQDFNLPALVGNSAMQEEMDGLPTTFDRIKIPSGGGLAFEVPGDDPDNPDTAREIVGVIVDHHAVNAYWADKYSGQNNPPDCSSLDGKVGVDKDGQRRTCNSCPLGGKDAWGSAEDGKGKACKNMHRVYILRDGDIIPLPLTLPPTSIKNFADYIGKRVLAKGRRSFEVLTRVTLKKAVSSGGITYSQAAFSIAGILHQDLAAKMAEYSSGIKAVTRNIEVANDEFAGGNGGTIEADVEVM
jgi:hypothetical protein